MFLGIRVRYSIRSTSDVAKNQSRFYKQWSTEVHRQWLSILSADKYSSDHPPSWLLCRRPHYSRWCPAVSFLRAEITKGPFASPRLNKTSETKGPYRNWTELWLFARFRRPFCGALPPNPYQ